MGQEYRLLTKNLVKPDYTSDIECYLKHSGYEVLKKALSLKPSQTADGKVVSPQEQLRQEVTVSGLRGRGGAGFSCGVKWSFVKHGANKTVYLICNADESEPGTFKDRVIIHKDPHQLLEGMIIACYANNVHLAYIYIRGEMMDGARILQKAINEAKGKGFLGKNILGSGYDLEIYIHRGAGAYICGEETGLIESLEGKRPYPRIKPPYFPAALGLYQCPTIVNNVETLTTVKHIIEMGGSTYAKLGTPNNTGTRLVCLSGQIMKPGLYEIEVGKVTIRDLIFDEAFGCGLRQGRKIKAIIPGGASAKVFRADEQVSVKRKKIDGTVETVEYDVLDLPYDFDTIAAAGSMSGSGAIIVLDDSADVIEALANIADFYAHESCGQCTPCREGSLWMSKILHRFSEGKGRKKDADLLLKIADNIGGGKTICAFGDACAFPVQSFVSKFKDEFINKANF